MKPKKQCLFMVPFLLFSFMLFSPHVVHAGSYLWKVIGGKWVLLQESIGISAMHMQVLNNNKVIMFDRTDFGRSNITLPDGKCRDNDEVVKPHDCTSHSVLYDIVSNTFRPLMLYFDTFCSSGTIDPTGTLIQTGGFLKGDHMIRMFIPCNDNSCDWIELANPVLMNRRWYASNQILPDGRIIIVGGRRVFTYEFYPKNSQIRFDNITLPFLQQTRDQGQENNLYPFLHLLPDGNLFIFANNRSILFDYKRNVVIKEYPVIPGGDKRNYPSTGSSVLLPLRLPPPNNIHTGVDLSPEAEVMICGGSPPGAFIMSNNYSIYVEASRTCGRLNVTHPKPEWVMELMPMPRVMSDMILLPTGDVLLINGAQNGTAGWNDATNAVYNPVLYQPTEDPTRRFVVLSPSKIARMYHSTAVLLPDGRILVGGSNPHRTYNFTANPYPTELSLEAFCPDYLDPQFDILRPSIVIEESTEKTVSYNKVFTVSYSLSLYCPDGEVSVVLITPSFTTHSFGMNQRMLVLNVASVKQWSLVGYNATVIGPTNANVAPPGYYMMFVVHAGIPGPAVWVKVQ